MFEYLMPTLLMESYEHTFLTQSCRAAVDYQIAYGQEKNVPWGISESSYYAFDANMTYQYRAFGVPGLGFQAWSRPGSGHHALRFFAGLTAAPASRSTEHGSPG